MAARPRIVVANWKLNPATLRRAEELCAAIQTEASRRRAVAVVVAPPFPYLAALSASARATAVVQFAAQDVFWERAGAHTGEVSAPMLASVGATHVIVGHSERRARGETDAAVGRKVAAALSGGLSPIVCIGERERDAHGNYLHVVEEQLAAALAEVPATKRGKLIIAYEPVWAISGGDGRGTTASPEAIHEMMIFIRRVLTERFSRAMAERIPVLYGGSVNEGNAADLMSAAMADGFLVGGASLKPRAFGTILSAVHGARS